MAFIGTFLLACIVFIVLGIFVSPVFFVGILATAGILTNIFNKSGANYKHWTPYISEEEKLSEKDKQIAGNR